jgi:hypothetical protein
VLDKERKQKPAPEFLQMPVLTGSEHSDLDLQGHGFGAADTKT